jgi:Protein of unknown function (DUF1360)
VTHAIEQSPAAGLGDGLPHDPLPRDYGAINAVYAALLVGLVVGTDGRLREEDRISTTELVPLGAATFALAKVVAREPFVDDAVHPHRPRGHRVRRALGELVMCTRCVGAWSALGLVGLRIASPKAGRTVIAVLATSAASDFLQASFRAVCGLANRDEAG